MPKLLARNGFSAITSTGPDGKKLSGYEHFLAERDGTRYAIRVITRNMLTIDGDRNSRYNIGADGAAAARQWNAAPTWVTIAVNEGIYCAYFGLLSDLELATGVPMKEVDVLQYECLANNEPHGIDRDIVDRN